MASTGTRGPKPWTQHRASTIFLRVPSADWTAVRHGRSGVSVEADDGSRTRDLRLGKPTLYQLSYVRAGAF
jgi:hypothetical protein